MDKQTAEIHTITSLPPNAITAQNNKQKVDAAARESTKWTVTLQRGAERSDQERRILKHKHTLAKPHSCQRLDLQSCTGHRRHCTSSLLIKMVHSFRLFVLAALLLNYLSRNSPPPQSVYKHCSTLDLFVCWKVAFIDTFDNKVPKGKENSCSGWSYRGTSLGRLCRGEAALLLLQLIKGFCGVASNIDFYHTIYSRYKNNVIL